jgi:hypothetical protein
VEVAVAAHTGERSHEGPLGYDMVRRFRPSRSDPPTLAARDQWHCPRDC